MSIELLGLSNDKGNYVVRCNHKETPRRGPFDSYDDALYYFRRQASDLISKGYFLPLSHNLSDIADYVISKKLDSSESEHWNTMERMPIDRLFFNEHYVREFYDGHHVLIKLSPSETEPFSMWDGRGTYTLSDTLLSKLSILHAYVDITGLILNTTLMHNGDIVINEIFDTAEPLKVSDRAKLEEMSVKAKNAPLRFLRFASYFTKPEEWHQRPNKTAYASFKKNAVFTDSALRYYFPSGNSYRVLVKSLYEVHAVSEKHFDELVLCLSKTPRISHLEIGESFVADGRRIYTQPMFDNLRIFSP
ncbi:hypothetical protein [Alteromonas gracilis]|uniref:hypothetical protein n=1 Tax=Alteromonas gracilis TaxID=1479524 RepID=UPI003735FE5C